MTRNRLLLLDGHSLAYRAFYALPVASFATSTGQPTNAVYGFTSMLLNLLRDEQPTHIAVAFDVSRQSFRTERFADYKANRASTPVEFKGQVGLIKEVLQALGITAVEAAGFEADDIIATLANQADDGQTEILICTGDRDTFQLVNDSITVLYPKKGVSEMSRMTPNAIQQKYGLSPRQYPDFAALRGDPSDNLPGVPGVGEKTAEKWIAEFGSLKELVAQAPSLKGKAGESLRENLGQILLNRELTQLQADVPLKIGMADMARVDADSAAVTKIFDALEFRAFKERVAPLIGNTPPKLTRHGAAKIEDVASWVAAQRGTIGFVIDPFGYIALATLGAAGWCDSGQVRDWLSDPEKPKVTHDAKSAMHAMNSVILGLVGDTALEAYLVGSGGRGNTLVDLVDRYLGYNLAEDSGSADSQGLLDLGAGASHDSLVAQAAAVVELHGQLAEQLDATGTRELLREVELPLTTLLARMEWAGIAVDQRLLTELADNFASEGAAATNTAFQVVGHDFNLASPKQLQAVLFDELKLPKTKKIKSGYTTDADALIELFAKTEHPVLAQILRYRDVTKLRTTIEGLQRAIAADGRIHTTFQQTVAATGRLSSADPNLQNIPVRSDEGRRIRECFIVGTGYETLLTADYSQIEMRIMAHLSRDESLLEAFHSGEDLHTSVAAEVFDVAPDSVDAEMRRKIKAMSYGLAYGLSSYGLSVQLGISDSEARDLMGRYFERFGRVRDYLRRVVEEARTRGYTETLLGRRRYLPDLNSDNRQRREMAERMALNAPIQGTAADIVKIAMLNVDSKLTAAGLSSRLLLQVHDELILEIVAGELAAVTELVEQEMGSAYLLDAPLTVNIGIGKSWAEAAH